MKKIVFTGSACSGKTTVINELSNRGYQVLPEVAREVISERKDFDLDKLEIEVRQKIILERQILEEEKYSIKDGILFLDRGVMDGIVYCEELLGYVPQFFSGLNLYQRYDRVFFLERFPFVQDEIRIEKSDKDVEKIHNRFKNIYQSYGHEVINVPLIDLSSRVDYILSKIEVTGNDLH